MADQKGDTLINQIFGDGAADNEPNNQDAAPVADNEPTDSQDAAPAPDTGHPAQDSGQPADQKPAKKYAGKFDSDEELEKAYLESQKFMTQKAQEAAQYRRQLEQLQQQLQQLQQATAPDMTKKQQEEFQNLVKKAINAAVVDEDPTLLLQLIDRLTEEKTEAKIRQIMPVIEPIARQNILEQHVQEFFADVPEAKDLEGEMAKLVQQEPELVYDANGNVRPNWPYRVYARVLKQQSAVAKTVNAQAAAQAAAAKAAASMPGSGVRQEQKKKSPEDELLDNIFGNSKREGIFG